MGDLLTLTHGGPNRADPNIGRAIVARAGTLSLLNKVIVCTTKGMSDAA